MATRLRWVMWCGLALGWWGCSPPQKESCVAGDVLVRRCGTCGTQRTECVIGTFSAFSDCVEPARCDALDAGTGGGGGGGVASGGGSGGGVGTETCNPGDIYERDCGFCGRQQRTCAGSTWGSWGACSGEGECAAGTTETGSCGTTVGSCETGARSRSCSDSCNWDPWGACGGAYVGPSPESCGDSLDNDCNGAADEGCACAPVGPDAGSSFVVLGAITKMIADPQRCFVYALSASNPSQVIVFDVAGKTELTRVMLPALASDIDLSPNGDHLVVALPAVHQLASVAIGLWTVSTVPTASDPYSVEISDSARAYYVEEDQWTDLRTLDLSQGISSDVRLNSWGQYAGDAELSSDGIFLFVGESSLSGSDLTKYNVSGGTAVQVSQSNWDDGYGFPYPERAVYVAPGNRHVYYAWYQLDGDDLTVVNGRTGERIFVEDPANRFAVGVRHLFDATLVRPFATFPRDVAAATLAASGRELWTFSPGDSRVHYVNVDDLVWNVPLGQRDLTPQPLAAYSFSKLVHDPVRARLYGLDRARESVVVIDAVTRTPLQEILVGPAPSSLAVSFTGQYLFVGHLGVTALARIDLATARFDRFITTPRVPYEVAALSGGRLAVIDEDQWTQLSLVDGVTGTVVTPMTTGGSIYEGTLTTASNGNVLFVGESSLSGSNITKYDVSSNTPVKLDESDYSNGYGFPYPARWAKALPDGSGVYYASYLLDGADLSILRYAQPGPIHNVTPDARLAISTTSVFRVADGGLAGPLPVPGAVQALDPSGETLFVATDGGLATVDLRAFP